MRDPAGRVVEIDGHRAVETGPFDVVEVVVANLRSPRGPVAAHVERADVASFVTDVVDFIQLDRVIIPAEQDRGMGPVVNQVVSHSDANALNADGRAVGPVEPTEMMDVVVFGQVPRRGKPRTIATAERHAALAGIEDIAADHPVPDPARHDNPAATGVADRATGDQAVAAARDGHRVAAASLEGETADRDVAAVAELEHLRLQGNERFRFRQRHREARSRDARGPDRHTIRRAVEFG